MRCLNLKLIWIAPECPYPANTGGRVGIWKRIEYLSKNNDIYLYCITDNLTEDQYVGKMKEYCKDVHLYSRINLHKALFSSIANPYPAVSRWNLNMKKDISYTYDMLVPDFVIVDLPQMLGVLTEKILMSNKIVLNQHNIEYQSLESIASSFNNRLKRLIYKIVSKQMKLYEDKIYNTYSIKLYSFVSICDKEFFEKKYFITNTKHVPVGAELKFDKEIKKDCHKMIFVAKMSYPANEDGALWLIDNVWNYVKEEIPDAELYLVGKNPSDRLKSKYSKNNGIIITGTVESIEKYYEMCNLVVVPIMTGGGVKVKLLEALGHGKIVITTTKGLEGTDFISNKHVLTADNSKEFANYCISVLKDPLQYEFIQKAAIKKMNKEYSWQGIMDDFEHSLLRMRKTNES